MLRHWIVTGFVTLSLTAAVVAAPSEAGAKDTPQAGAVSIYETAEPIRLDGVLDEEAWRRAHRVEVKYAHGSTGQAAERTPMVARFTYDEHYFYIAYETFDPDLRADTTGRSDGPEDNLRLPCRIAGPGGEVDVAEFFLSFGSPHFFWEVHHNAANHFSDIWCTVFDPDWKISESTIAPHGGIVFSDREHIRDDPQNRLTLKTVARPKVAEAGRPGTINDGRDVDAGYVAELRLPWIGLGAPKANATYIELPPERPGQKPREKHGPWRMQGVEMRILSVVQDADAGKRYHHSGPTLPGGWFHRGFEHYPTYILAGPGDPGEGDGEDGDR
jgi:hypothetical protein